MLEDSQPDAKSISQRRVKAVQSGGEADRPPAIEKPSSEERQEIFVSYSHADEETLNRLKIHLTPLVRVGRLMFWSDTNIRPGEKWREEIRKALRRASVAILLVSPEFLASDFIANEELPPLLDSAEKEGLTILWIPVSASNYKRTSIAEYQAAYDPARPLDTLGRPDQNRAWVTICERIEEAVLLKNN